jgi:hypothetical protein
MAQNRTHITMDNFTEWLASTGFLFPRTELELARFEKLFPEAEDELVGKEIDPEVILGTKQRAPVIPFQSKSKEDEIIKFRMAARKGDSSVSKKIMDRIKNNQNKRKQDDDGSEKERSE